MSAVPLDQLSQVLITKRDFYWSPQQKNNKP